MRRYGSKGAKERATGSPVGHRSLLASWLVAGLLLSTGTAAGRPADVVISPRAALPACTIVGTAGDETLDGTSGDDVICALGGDDRVRGGGGDDVIFGSTGDDVLDGGPGDDRLYGYSGRDRLRGGPGQDLLEGSAGPDAIAGGSGADMADYRLRRGDLRVSLGDGANDGFAGERDDVRGDVEGVRAGAGDDVLVGNRAANRLHGGGGNDLLRGGRGDDRLWGDRGDDRLWGGEGRDRLEGRDGAGFRDWLRCGAGVDVAFGDARDHMEACDQPIPQSGPAEPPGHAPAGISLSPASVAENRPAGTVVGTLTAADRGRRRYDRFELVSGAGSADNGSFRIAGSTLRTAAVFDYEAKSRYSIRVRARARRSARSIERILTVSVRDVNEAPAALALSGASVPENDPAGTMVGTLSASDPDVGDVHTFALVPGTGAADNGSFRIEGSTLTTAAVFDYEAKQSYTVRVRATDHGTPAGSIERAFTIAVTDVAEAPIADAKTVSGTEEQSATIGLSGSDPAGRALTFAVVSGPGHGGLDTTAPPAACGATPNACTASVQYTPTADFNGADSFAYRVDNGTQQSAPVTVSIRVSPVNDVPQAASGSLVANEDGALPLDLGALVSDVETGDASLTYTIVAPPGHGHVTGAGASPTYTPDADYHGPDSLTYRVADRGDPDNCSSAPCDAARSSTTETVSITVQPVNDAPQTASSSVSVDEDGSPLAVDLGSLVSDLETGDADLTYSIVTPPAHGGLSGSGTSRAYAPAANFNGADSFSYEVTDRGDPDNCPSAPCDPPKSSSPQTVSITVNPVNDAPLAAATSVSADEDGSLPVDLGSLVTDVETGDADLSYTIVTPPAHGGLSGTGASRTYVSAANFSGTDSFTYEVTDRGDPDGCSSAPCDANPKTSTTETVSITVAAVNDAPLAGSTSLSVDEDGSLPVDLAALVSDLETANSANLTYAIVTPPAHGGVTGGGAARTYAPAANFSGTDSFTYEVTDRGDPDNCASAPCDPPKSATGTVTITVNAVNDAPVNTLPAGPVTTLADTDAPLAGVSIADIDAAADVVELKLSVLHGTVTVSTSVPFGLVMGDVAGNGTDSATITATLAKINTTLADADGLVYRVVPGFTGADTLTATSNDLGHNGSGGPLSDTDTLAIIVNTPPVAAPQSVTTNEDTAKTITLSASDADGDDPLTFAHGTAPTHGSLGTIGTVTCSHATPNVCTAGVVYTPAADYSGPDSFTFTANDGVGNSAPATVSITVDAVNDVPQLQNIEPGALAYTENDPATVLMAATTVSDVDSANFDTGTLTVDYAAGGTADDRLEIRNVGSGPGQIGVSGATVSYEGIAIGTFSGGTGTTPLVVTLDANATAPATQALVRAVTYRNVSEAPSTAARTVRFVLTDGDGGTSAPATRALALTAVNDVPVLAGIEPGALGYTENDAATPVTSSLTVTDPDSSITGATITIVDNLAPAEDVLSFTNQLGISGSYSAATGMLTLTGSGSPADYQTALRAVRYSNTSENPSALTRRVSFQVQDGPAPANRSNVESRDVTVTSVNDAPVADDETFNGNDSAHGNTAMIVNDPDDGAPNPAHPKTTVTGDILAGDTDVDGPGPLTVTPGTFATNDGGSVTIESDGDFTFHPAASTSCTDTSDFFDYTVADSGSPELTDTGRVTIQIAGCVWYVSNNGAGNSGTSSAPFDTLAQAEAASGANHTVFVFDGDNTSTGLGGDGYAMNAGERLIGEHEGLVVDPDQGGGLTADTLHPANAGAHPTLTASNADVISLDDGNELRGLNIDPDGTGGGIAGGAGDTLGGTIDDVNIVDGGTAGTQAGLELDGTTGLFNITNVAVNNKATGVLLNNAGTTDFGSTTITSDGGPGLSATGTNMSTSEFAAITSSNSGNGGVNLDGTTGTTLLGDGTGTDLSLTTTSGTQPAFRLSNAGTVTVGAAGTDNVAATGGAAVDVTGTSGVTLDFDDVDSTNSTGDGINLAGLGTGTFSAASGTIGGAAAIAFDLDGGSGTVSYPGALNDGTGQAAEITGRTGGAVTLGGAIADGADAGGSISLSGNTGGSTTFSNASKVLNTTTAAAVSFTGSDGHTLTLSGGGLDIDTTSGAGINATNSGTLTVSGAGNTIASTTGTALNAGNTDLGGATFQSISANGAANGINLNNTGSTAGLTVTGSGNATQGGDNSGGTIQNTTGHGIALANTSSPSFTNMRLLNTGASGVNGTQVSGFSFTNGTITGAGNADDENSITFDDSLTNANLTGAVTITNNVISQTEAEGVDIHNFAGTISNANISGNALSDTGDVATPGSAISLLAGGQPTAAASITRAAISNNTITDFRAGVGVQVRGGNASAGGPPGNAGIAGSATDIIAVTGNLMNGGSGGVGNQPDRFFTGGAAGIGQGNFNVSNNGTAANRIRMIDCIPIELQADGPVTMTSTVQNNFINANSAVGCAGIAVGTDDPSNLGAGTHSTLISGNNVMGTDGPGIFPIVRDSDSTMTARVINNTVAAPITTNAARAGIRVDSGSAAGDTTLCLEISGNTTAGSTNTGTATTSPGINLRKQGTDPAVDTFGIEGMAATSSPGVETYVNGLNTSTSGTFGTGGTALLSAMSGFTNCIAP